MPTGMALIGVASAIGDSIRLIGFALRTARRQMDDADAARRLGRSVVDLKSCANASAVSATHTQPSLCDTSRFHRLAFPQPERRPAAAAPVRWPAVRKAILPLRLGLAVERPADRADA